MRLGRKRDGTKDGTQRWPVPDRVFVELNCETTQSGGLVSCSKHPQKSAGDGVEPCMRRKHNRNNREKQLQFGIDTNGGMISRASVTRHPCHHCGNWSMQHKVAVQGGTSRKLHRAAHCQKKTYVIVSRSEKQWGTFLRWLLYSTSHTHAVPKPRIPMDSLTPNIDWQRYPGAAQGLVPRAAQENCNPSSVAILAI